MCNTHYLQEIIATGDGVMQVNLYTVLLLLLLAFFVALGSFVVGLKATPLWVYQLASKRSFHILWHYN